MARQILLIEDSPGDVRLTQEAFRDAETPIKLHVVSDGAQAMDFLRREGAHADAPRPDLILLDLDLPGMDGREVLALIKRDAVLRAIPTVILTSSDIDTDVLTSYRMRANCFFRKPMELDAYETLVRSISDFWLTKAQLPTQARAR